MTTMVCGKCQLGECNLCLDAQDCQCRRPQHRKLFRTQDVWEQTEFGVRWGPLEVERMTTIDKGPKNGGYTRVVRITAGERHNDKDLEIHVSETGRSLRVFRGGKELS